MAMTYRHVMRIFDKAYERLRDESHEYAPSSYTYIADSIESMMEEANLDSDKIDSARRAGEYGGGQHGHVGNAGDPIAYVYYTEEPTLVAIHADATHAEVKLLLDYLLGFAEGCPWVC